MKSIVFHKESYYLRKGIYKIEIEEENLKSISQGLAIARAKVYCSSIESNFSSYKKPKMSIYYCEGVINENFEEAFWATSETDPSKYLMFREVNKKIMRFGINDFVVEQLHKEQGRLEKRYTHLKLIYNKPYIVKEGMKDFSFTSLSDTVILEHQFYIVSASKLYGPKFTFLKEDENYAEEFLVVDKIRDYQEEMQFPIVDVLTYRMDKNFQITSYVYSLLEGKSPIYTRFTSAEEIRKERLELLQDKKRILEAKLSNLVKEQEDAFYTSFPNITIQNNQFCYVGFSKTYGPKFLLLREDENQKGEFIVIDEIKVTRDVQSKFSFTITDLLIFRMNKDFQVLSLPYSLLEDSPLYFSSLNYYEILKERKNALMKKKTLFKENIESLERARTLR